MGRVRPQSQTGGSPSPVRSAGFGRKVFLIDLEDWLRRNRVGWWTETRTPFAFRRWQCSGRQSHQDDKGREEVIMPSAGGTWWRGLVHGAEG